MSAVAAKYASYLVIGNDPSIRECKRKKKKKDHTENPHQNVLLETLTFP